MKGRLFSSLILLVWFVSACGGTGDSSIPVPSTSLPSDSTVENESITLNLFAAPAAPELERMSAASDEVVVGTVLSVQSRYERAELGKLLIVSYVQVAVEETVKGEASGIVTVRTIGGQVGGRMLVVSHVPVFRHAGEKVLLFLKRDGGRYKIPFDEPGKILVHEDETLAFLDGTIPVSAVRDLLQGVER